MGARKRPLVVMLGTRGCPDVQGGVEKHVEALSPLLVARGWDVEVMGRAPYLPPGPRLWRGVTITPLWAPRRKSLETILHTLLGVFAAARRRPDIVHIHAIGPALLTPLARLFGLKVVVTHHGYDYDRDKWNGFARTMLRLGERFGMRWASRRIAVAPNIARTMEERYGKPTRFLPNGVAFDGPAPDAEVLGRFGLKAGRYVLNVSRIVPEKRQLDLIAAYGRLADPDFSLVIVGGADHKDAYEESVRAAAAATPGVVMTGFQSGGALAGLFAHAGLFVLPSSHEGMPIALLEALGHGLPVLASDIIANTEIGLDPDCYFPLGDTDALAGKMAGEMAAPLAPETRAARIEEVRETYGWAHVADAMAGLYDELAFPDRPRPEAVAQPAE